MVVIAWSRFLYVSTVKGTYHIYTRTVPCKSTLSLVPYWNKFCWPNLTPITLLHSQLHHLKCPVPRKRLFEEYEMLESINKLTKITKLHSVISNLSLMKAEKYFEGELADDTAAMRIVGFNTKLQQELSEQIQEGQSH